MPDVLQRMVQLEYTSRLPVDKKFLDKIDGFVDLMAKIDKRRPERRDARRDPTYEAIRAHRKINHFRLPCPIRGTFRGCRRGSGGQ